MQGKDYRSGIAAGVGDELRASDLGAMQFRQSVDRLRLSFRGDRRAVVLESIDGAVGGLVQAPRAAEVDDAQAVCERLGHPLTRLLMRCGEKQDFDAAIVEQLPREGLQLQSSSTIVVGKLGVDIDERNSATRRVVGVDTSGEDRRRAFEPRMVEQEAGQFGACVAGDPHNGSLNFLGHDSNIVLRRDSTSAALRWSGQMTSTVSSPATVPTTSGHSS